LTAYPTAQGLRAIDTLGVTSLKQVEPEFSLGDSGCGSSAITEVMDERNFAGVLEARSGLTKNSKECGFKRDRIQFELVQTPYLGDEQ
jgi:hypothetical protein